MEKSMESMDTDVRVQQVKRILFSTNEPKRGKSFAHTFCLLSPEHITAFSFEKHTFRCVFTNCPH